MSLRAAASLFALLALAGCGSNAKKPSDADIAAYLGQTEPAYLRLGNITTSFEAAAGNVPAGSWVVHVKYSLHATQDLYAPTPAARTERATFDAAVMKFEAFRTTRIAAVEQLALRNGLMRRGDGAPEPAVPLEIVTHKDQDRDDGVTLLAQPDGAGWKFAQKDAQLLSDDAIGAPLADIKATSADLHFVVVGTEEERDFHNRMLGFLARLNQAGQAIAP
jgi:hypothetical protein